MRFSGILKLIKSGRFLRHRVNISRNLKLIDFNKFPRFRFGVKAVYYTVFLLIIRGSK